MSERAHEFKIGAFVLAGVGLILAGLVAFAFSRDVEPVYNMETYVEGDVDGLSVGSAVKLRGVAVGQVSSIHFSWNEYPPGNPRCVVIRFTVAKKQSPIPVGGDEGGQLHERVEEGLRAVVQGEGITGTSILALKYVDPKRYPPLEFGWTPKTLYIPAAPSEFSQILTAINKTLGSVEKINFEAIGKSVQGKIDDLDTRAISVDIQRMATEVRTTARDIRTELASMRLEEVGKNANQLLVGLQGTSDRLERTAGRLSTFDFRNLNDTLAGTRQAARELNEVLEELKRYPAGFLFGDPPPPASAVSKEKK
jgi:ABC-type transporter Mla subunit MlaD